jgi:hypothetical protein
MKRKDKAGAKLGGKYVMAKKIIKFEDKFFPGIFGVPIV